MNFQVLKLKAGVLSLNGDLQLSRVKPLVEARQCRALPYPRTLLQTYLWQVSQAAFASSVCGLVKTGW